MRIEEVSPSECLDSVTALLASNWEETGFDFELRPDKANIALMERAGVLFALAAFDDEEIVGYSAAFVTPHHFNPEVTHCSTTALYVRPDKRGTLSARLIKMTEEAARWRGARFISWHTRAGTPLASVLERRGYTPADVVVIKDLRHGH